MESSYPDDEIKRLHASFIEVMESDRNYTSFSEDDLIDIFDYTCSLSDTYVMAEVVIAGEIHYSNSKELLKRKALLYHHLDQEDVCLSILNQLPSDHFLNIIASTKTELNTCGWFDSFCGRLVTIPDGTIEDGDIIYTVDFFNSLNRIDILVKLADELSRLSEYPSTIYNELFHLFCENGEYVSASEFGKKFTEIEPFNSFVWTELADLYNAHLGDTQAALECVDFALAIDPDSLGALLVKSSAIFESDPDESRRVVDKMMSISPTDPMSFYARAIFNINNGNKQQGIDDLLQAISSQPTNGKRELVELLLKVIDKPLNDVSLEMIKSIFEEDDSIDAVKWCDSLILNGRYVGACQLFELAYEIGRFDFSAKDSIYIAVESLYRMSKFNQIKDLLDLGCKNKPQLRLKLPMPLALIYSLVWFRISPISKPDIISFLNNRLSVYMSKLESRKVNERLIDEAAAKRMKLFVEELSSGSEDIRYLDIIDPFV